MKVLLSMLVVSVALLILGALWLPTFKRPQVSDQTPNTDVVPGDPVPLTMATDDPIFDRASDPTASLTLTLPQIAASGTVLGFTNSTNSSEPILFVPDHGPATGSGRPCQILTGDGDREPEPPADSPPLLVWASRRYHWVEPATLPDGDYVGMLRVRDGRVQPCTEIRHDGDLPSKGR